MASRPHDVAASFLSLVDRSARKGTCVWLFGKAKKVELVTVMCPRARLARVSAHFQEFASRSRCSIAGRLPPIQVARRLRQPMTSTSFGPQRIPGR